ncbi:Rrf2 family transcriptional regulator [Thomasclavelia sp.]|uniref:Rrf2 family transcriptional regulator n=1 Tax=Thomasclavelia sp. TaxID=3025757 RepID=UPI0025EBC7F8|nr:Rrf2 family transcriptional regulator [Thomasclavelia sp.]
MKYSVKLSDAVHILVIIALNPLENLTSQTIANSIYTNPSFIRQLMSKMKKAGILSSVHGHALPSLAKDAKMITLLDVYKAVEGDKPLLHLNTHTNPECGVGVNIQYTLQEYYDDIQQHIETKMDEITLQDIIDQFLKNINQ